MTGPGGGTANSAPSASISSPSDGSAFREDASITFQGSGSDPEDGELTGRSLQWSSDIDGDLGAGRRLTRDDLTARSPARHTVTLTAVDSEGDSATASITVEVTADQQVDVEQPGDESAFREGDPISFEGSASDPDDGALTGASLTWSSDVDGELGTGGSVTTSGLSAGPHAITLAATDADGNTVSASVSLLVESPGFDIRLRFVDAFSDSTRATIRDALAPWQAAVTGDLSPVFADSSLAASCQIAEGGIDDLAVAVETAELDGTGGALARAGPRAARSDAGGDPTTPVCGIVTVDEADRDNPQLERIVTHEVGHVLGIGIEPLQGWGSNANTTDARDPFFTGDNTVQAFDDLGGEAYLSDGVPLANQGGRGTASAHWREDNFANELMTGFLGLTGSNPLSRVSVASLADIGFTVDLSAAESFDLPMPQPAIWEPEADATLSRPASSDANFGGPPGTSALDSAVVAGANNGTWTADPDDERFTGLLRFTVPPAPAGVTVSGATLVLVPKATDTDTTSQEIEVFPVGASWSEDQVTWTGIDSATALADSAVLTFPHDTSDTSLTSSALADLAQSWADGSRANHGLGFRAPTAGSIPEFSVGFFSRHEDTPLVEPRMTVDAGTGAAVRARLRGGGERIHLGDDILSGPLYLVDGQGRVVRVVEIR